MVTIQRTYPLSIFPLLWDKLGDLANAGRLIAPREVFNELRRGGDDEIFRWANDHQGIFIDLDPDQSELVKEIVNNPA
ncbi:MAG: DUF4411 family protein [Chloroflexi bacterium]|nr:DUF4411 family protein [Chloroflexota bacterium]